MTQSDFLSQEFARMLRDSYRSYLGIVGDRPQKKEPEPLQEDDAPISHIWRGFRVQRNSPADGKFVLVGAYTQYWKYSELKAVCRDPNSYPTPEHDAPNEACGCGIYGWYEPGRVIDDYIVPRLYSGEILALARCEYWGKTIVGRKGVRTENAKIVKLMLIKSTRTTFFGPRMEDALNDLRERYSSIPEIIAITADDLLTIRQG